MGWLRSIWARRWARRLLIAGVVVGLGLAAYRIVVDRLPGWIRPTIEQAWVDQGLPGTLTVGAIEWPAPTQVVLRQVAIGEAWSLIGGAVEPLATVDRVQVELVVDGGGARPARIVISGARLRLDQRSYRFLHAITDVLAAKPPTVPPRVMDILAQGEVVIASGARLSGVEARIHAVGPLVSGPVTGRLGDEPFRLDITSRRTAGGAREYTYAVSQARGDLHQALDAVACLGITGALPRGLLRWFPRQVDAAGTVIVNDPEAHTYTGTAHVAWDGGAASGAVELDRRRAVVTRLAYADARLGAIEAGGRLAFERDSEVLAIEARIDRAGPDLPIPPEILRDQAAALLPLMAVTIPTRRDAADATVLRLSGAGTSDAQLAVRWLPGDGIRVEGAGLPLAQGQRFLPPGLALAGGTARSLLVRIRDGRLDTVDVTAAQARVAWRGWTLGPTDGRVVLAPGDKDWLACTAELLPPPERRGEPPIAVMRWEGTPDAATITASAPAMEAVATRLRGPMALPGLRGPIAARLLLGRDGPARTIQIQRLDTDGGGIALDGLMRGAVIAIERGQVHVEDERWSLSCAGQATAGDLLLGGQWIPAATRQPLFLVSLVGEDGRIRLREALVRAGAGRGLPAADGWTGQLSGLLDDGDGHGFLTGVVDRIALPWLLALTGQTGIRLSGEGAATVAVVLDDLRPAAITGTFLPLGAQAAVGGVTAGGLTGAVRFRFAGGDALPRPGPAEGAAP
jgi:hypothetical protein